ncbi:MAG TPA: flagellar basal body rod protein FlgC [Thermodesulfovibrionales bacterium]|jgi:flagellar basal-body rod protein FlgC|nr:flagellar basal body rod protein FlgC [Thermodesulfovibrionales bacterium]
MNTFDVLKVSASALDAQRQRMNVLSSNMANVHSTRTDEGGPYKRRDVVFATMTVESDPGKMYGVRVDDVTIDDAPPKKVYDPSHPDADNEGYVAMPDINILEEMTNMMMAFRAYEASVSAFNMSKSMFMKSLELGRV